MSKRKERAVHFLAFVALVANLFAPVFTLPVTAEDLVNTDPVVTMNEADEAEKQRQAEEEAEKQRQAEADAAATKAAEEAAATKAAEDAVATKAAEDAAATKAAEEEAAKQQAEQERIAEEERLKQEEAKKQAEEEAAKNQAEENTANGDEGIEGDSNNAQNQTKSESSAPAKSLVPHNPQVVGCGVDLAVTGAAGPAGVVYNVTPNEDGSYTVTASIDPSMVGSHVLNVDGTDWTPNGDVATYLVEAIPCPEMGTMGHDNEKKVWICHANQGSKEYTYNHVGVSSMYPNGHEDHAGDAWPAYTDKNGDPRPAGGNQALLEGDCHIPAPILPDPVEATCATAPDVGLPPNSAFFTYSASPTAPWSAGQEITVTATTVGGFILPGSLPNAWTNNGWQRVSDTSVKYVFDFEDVDCAPDVTIEKTVDNPPKYANGVSWTITVKNHGDAKQRVQIIETSPDGEWTWELLGGYCDSDGIMSGGQWQWKCDFDVPAQKNGTPGVKTLSFSSEMAKDCGSYPNTATLQVGEWTGNGWSWTTVDSASSTFVKECSAPDLSIAKDLNKPSNGIARPGDTIKFNVTVNNHGSNKAEGVIFTDTLPVEFVGSGWTWDLDGCSLDDNIITCGPFNLNGGKSKTFTFSASVPADGSVCGPFTNTAQLPSGGSSGDNGIQTASGNQNPKPRQTADSASVTIKCEPGIKVEKSADREEVEVGDSFTYTIKVSNTGDTTLSGFVVTDQLDTNYLSFVSSEGDLCAESTAGSGLVTCDVPNLTPQGQNGATSRTFKITVEVKSDLDPEMCETWIKNTAHVGLPEVQRSGSGGDNSGPVEDTSNTVKTRLKECDPRVEIEKNLVSDQTAEPGEEITFKVTVKNSGDGAATGVTFTDTMDAPLGELTWTISPEGVCDVQTGGGYLCGPFDLANDGEQVVTFTAPVPVDGSVCSVGWLYNNAALALSEPQYLTHGGQNGGNDDDPKTEDSAKVKINCDPDIEIVKTGPADAAPGETFVYTLTVTNEGNVPLENYVVTDELDTDYISFVSSELCQESSPGSGEITCNVPELTPDGQNGPTSQEFVITVQVNTDLEPHQCDDQFYNKAFVGQVAPVNGISSDEHNGDNGGSDSDWSEKVWTSLKDCNPGIEITKTDDVADDEYVLPDGTYTYTITVETTGTIAASGYVMTDTLESYLAFAFAGDLPEGCSISGQTLTCNVPTMEPGAPAWEIQVPVTLVESPSGEQCAPAYNKAEVEPMLQYLSTTNTNNGDNNGNTYDSEDEWTNVACPDIEVSKKDTGSEPVNPGEAFTYEIKVTNSGNVPLTDIVVQDLLPNGLEVVGWSVVEGVSCDDTTLECTIDSLASTASVTLELEVKFITNLTANMCDGVWNEVDVVGNYGEIEVSDDDDEETMPNCEPDFSFEKHAADYSAEPGDTIEYTITLTNEGNIDIASATITDELDMLPVGHSWTISETGPIECALAPDGVSLTCDLTGNLIPEASATVTIAAEIPEELVLTENGNEWCKPWSNTANVNGTYSTYELQVPEFAALGNDRVESTFDEDWTDTVFVNCTGILIEKEAPGEVDPGGNITYAITVTNMGNVPVEFQVTDVLDSRLSEISAAWQYDMGDPLDCSVEAATNTVTCDVWYLASGNSVTITINATVIAEPTTEQCEPIVNTANVSEYSRAVVGLVPLDREITIPQGESIPSNPVETTVNCQPDLDLEKTGNVEEDGGIVFTITATNTGTGYADDQTIVDTLPEGLAGLDWDIALNPADTETECGIEEGVITCEPVFLDQYDGTLEITLTAQTDAQNPVCGEYTNVAAMGQLEADAMVTIECVPNYEVEKTSAITDDADDNGALSVGDTITYTIAVTNTGNQDLSGITLDDQFTGVGEGGLTWTVPADFDGENVPDVMVGGSIGLVATYVITQADVDAGEIENCALMTYPVDEETTINREDCADDDLDQDPLYEVEKTSAITDDADDNGTLSAGDTITYTITVTNNGTVTLSGITLDDQFTGVGEGGLTWTAPADFDGENVPDVMVGGSIDLVATYVIIQADVDAGEIENCALMTYQVDDETVINRDDCAEDDIRQNPGVDMVKTGTVSGGAEVLQLGNTITYTFTVTNTGNVTIDDLEIDDPMEGVEFADGTTIATLAPGESVELTAEYEVAQSDVNTGMILNCADVAGMAANGTEVTDQGCDTKLVDQERNLDVLVAHECPGPVDELLQEGNFEVTYELTIVNNGTVTVHDIVMTTSHEGILDQPFPTTFEPGQSETRQWTIVATEEEFESGEINVDITVVGKTENGASAMLASMALQVLGDDVESRLVLTCPIDVPVEPDTTPKLEKVASVVDLPNTGSGSIASTASLLWAAAMLSVLALGASAVGVRRRW